MNLKAIDLGFLDSQVTFKCGDAYSGPENQRALSVNSTTWFYRVGDGPWYRTRLSRHIAKQWLEVCDSESELHEALEGELFV